MVPSCAQGDAGAQPAPKQSDFRWNLGAGIALLVAAVATWWGGRWWTGQPAIAVVFACSGLVFLILAGEARPATNGTAQVRFRPDLLDDEPAAETPLPEAGWFPDPSGEAGLRWWDGSQWTDHTYQSGD